MEPFDENPVRLELAEAELKREEEAQWFVVPKLNTSLASTCTSSKCEIQYAKITFSTEIFNKDEMLKLLNIPFKRLRSYCTD